MTRYRYYTATSLDGFLADEHDSLDWLFEQEGGEDVVSVEGSPVDHDRFAAGVGAVVMGATTYEWIGADLARKEAGWPYPQPTFVFTHRDLAPLADHVTFLAGEPAAHRVTIEAAAAGGDVWMVGGGGLAADFAAAGMLDDVLLSYAPVTLGAGRPLFTRPFDLRLREHARAGPFLVAVYDVVGPRAGSSLPASEE